MVVTDGVADGWRPTTVTNQAEEGRWPVADGGGGGSGGGGGGGGGGDG